MKLTVVVPAYNEKGNIGRLIDSLITKSAYCGLEAAVECTFSDFDVMRAKTPRFVTEFFISLRDEEKYSCKILIADDNRKDFTRRVADVYGSFFKYTFQE